MTNTDTNTNTNMNANLVFILVFVILNLVVDKYYYCYCYSYNAKSSTRPGTETFEKSEKISSARDQKPGLLLKHPIQVTILGKPYYLQLTHMHIYIYIFFPLWELKP